METRIAKKSRFQIVKLEERVAPASVANAFATAFAYGGRYSLHVAYTSTYTSTTPHTAYAASVSESATS